MWMGLSKPVRKSTSYSTVFNGNRQNYGNMCFGTVQAFQIKAGGMSTIRSKNKSSSGLMCNLGIIKNFSAD